ncbi:MAG: iron ABC transporter permease [Candidatus Tectomicrobia bacterium]|nr:iron ABC transporter permease [Candidatus Tectomicrobia bacterium]
MTTDTKAQTKENEVIVQAPPIEVPRIEVSLPTLGQRLRRELNTLLLLIPIFAILFAYVFYPSFRVFIESLYRGGRLSLGNYGEFFNWRHPANLQALRNSLYISLGSVIFSAMIGIPLAYLFTRFEFPGRSTFAALAILPLTLPPLLGVLSFMFLYGESGILPRGLQVLLKLKQAPFSIDGVPAIFVVHAYSMYVHFYIFVSAALRGIDPSVHEAAYNLGASRWFAFRRITLPLLIPALVGASLLVFMTSMASFSAPFIFASGYRVLSLQIYNSKLNGDWNMALTQTVILSLFSIMFLFMMRSYSARREYAMIGKGVGAQRAKIESRFWRWVAGGIGIVAVVLLILPHLTIILISFVKDGTWTWQVLPPKYTIENYVKLFKDPTFLDPIKNSLKMASVATLGNFIFGIFAAYLLVKRKFWGKGLIDTLVMVPFALPGTVVAINLIITFNKATIFSFNQVLVGTFWILPLAYFVRHIPLVVRMTVASLEQLDNSLEEAARNLGASWFYTFRRVVIPLVLPGVFAGTLLSFVTSLGEFVSSILLYVYSNRPISIEILSHLRQFNFGSAAAYSVFLIFIISAVLIFSSRVLRVGAERGE